ncbi:hypothetical protein KC717_06245, partial [Candidatus Dojkabacteria bacterium]|nr:hypothetical protein [Candidatus Dojkabacteria bacterium]
MNCERIGVKKNLSARYLSERAIPKLWIPDIKTAGMKQWRTSPDFEAYKKDGLIKEFLFKDDEFIVLSPPIGFNGPDSSLSFALQNEECFTPQIISDLSCDFVTELFRINFIALKTANEMNENKSRMAGIINPFLRGRIVQHIGRNEFNPDMPGNCSINPLHLHSFSMIPRDVSWEDLYLLGLDGIISPALNGQAELAVTNKHDRDPFFQITVDLVSKEFPMLSINHNAQTLELINRNGTDSLTRHEVAYIQSISAFLDEVHLCFSGCFVDLENLDHNLRPIPRKVLGETPDNTMARLRQSQFWENLSTRSKRLLYFFAHRI